MADPKYLHIRVEAHIDDGGSWDAELNVPLPEFDLTADELKFLILQRIDNAAEHFQEKHFGIARAARFLRAYSVRAEAIQGLLETAPLSILRSEWADRVRAVLDADNDDIFAEYGDPNGEE